MESYKDICRYVCPPRHSFHTFHKISHAADLLLNQPQENAKFKGRFFADPTRDLYHALGMDIETLERTPKGQAKPSYISIGPIRDIMQSLWVNLSCLPS